MSMWNWFKTPKTAPKERTVSDREGAMIGEPVKSFLQSLKQERKRYKLQRVLKLSKENYPDFTCYHWMRSDGFWELTDTKTGKTFGAYIHQSDSVYSVYSLPFRLNHWELKALWDAFNGDCRTAAKERKARMVDARYARLREARYAQEQKARLEFAEQFK